MGDFGPPVVYTEAKWAQEVAMKSVKPVIMEVWDEFAKQIGRRYLPVEYYKADGAKVLLLTMGSFSETAMTAVDKLQAEGTDIGLIRLRLWRPFPFDEVREAVKNADTLIVLDRALSSGGPGGPVCSEVKAAIYPMAKRPKVVSFVGGMGGRDISRAGFEQIIKRGTEIARKGSDNEFEIFGVRE
jgi:pyruvate ferredoxin oxidoreductase alpha subunit